MKKETLPTILGVVLLALGIVILLMVFNMVKPITEDPKGFIDEHFPEEEEEVDPPTAKFAWRSEGSEVEFKDLSEAGDYDITGWSWDFGDGNTSTDQSPTYTYGSPDNTFVTLEVTDSDGNTARSTSDIEFEENNTRSGVSEEGSEDPDFDLGFGDMLRPIFVVSLTIGSYMILVAIGGRICKAGWNLLHPRPVKVVLKMKPKNMETVWEEAEPPEAYRAPARAAAPPRDASAKPKARRAAAPPPAPAKKASRPKGKAAKRKAAEQVEPEPVVDVAQEEVSADDDGFWDDDDLV